MSSVPFIFWSVVSWFVSVLFASFGPSITPWRWDNGMLLVFVPPLAWMLFSLRAPPCLGFLARLCLALPHTLICIGVFFDNRDFSYNNFWTTVITWMFSSIGAACAMTVIAGIASNYVWIGRLSRRAEDNQKCRECRYDLTGNVSGVCPECGTRITSQRDARREG